VPPSRGRLAAQVAAGIVVTRILGFVRERLFAHYFGSGPQADAFRAALKIPNVIRVLLGEGTLSASFIPVYAAMIERGDRDGARTLAGAVASILVLVSACCAVVGVLLAPVITDIAAPGFAGSTRALTVRLVAIMFPMAGVLILSAWCLGVLNTHGRFFLSYAAPALWNAAQIAVLVALGARLMGTGLVVALAWGALAGSALQLAAQLPATLRLTRGIAWRLRLETPGVARVLRAWLPVVVGAGVAQISSIVDTQLASLLGNGAVATLGYAQLLSTLPLSLFGVSVAAAALPDMSRDAAARPPDLVRERLADGLRRLAFLVVPSAFALAALGRPMVAAIFQTGSFGATETDIVSGVLAAYAIGVPGQAAVKLLASGHYAMGDTRTPMRVAGLAVVVSAVLGWTLMRWFGAAGIALGSSAGALLNVALNYAGLERRLGALEGREQWRALGITAAAASAAALAGSLAAGSSDHAWLGVIGATLAFAIVYGGVCLMLRHPDAAGLLRSIRRS
jgi:putative peptidoglycan lipid II flippase